MYNGPTPAIIVTQKVPGSNVESISYDRIASGGFENSVLAL